MHKSLPALCAVLLSLFAGSGEARDFTSPLFDQLPGKWAALKDGKADCSDAQVISFAKDRSTATFTLTKPFKNDDGDTVSKAVYQVLRAQSRSITLFLNGEKRETAGGDPVVWTLVQIRDDAFVWRQTDWAPGESTIPFVRCTDPT